MKGSSVTFNQRPSEVMLLTEHAESTHKREIGLFLTRGSLSIDRMPFNGEPHFDISMSQKNILSLNSLTNSFLCTVRLRPF